MEKTSWNLLISHFEDSQGLDLKDDYEEFHILQKQDRKLITIQKESVQEVILRDDTDDKPFIQVNFTNGTKVLLTEELIGFKPYPIPGLDLDKLPKVVTTSDLVSVFEAAEEALSAGRLEEVEVLRNVFHAILMGGECIGFDLTSEKGWFIRLQPNPASA